MIHKIKKFVKIFALYANNQRPPNEYENTSLQYPLSNQEKSYLNEEMKIRACTFLIKLI